MNIDSRFIIEAPLISTVEAHPAQMGVHRGRKGGGHIGYLPKPHGVIEAGCTLATIGFSPAALARAVGLPV